jgi:hypothetical protein
MSAGAPRVTPQLFIGLMVTVIGVLFLFENLGIARRNFYVLRYWPAGLIVIGLVKLWQSRDRMGASFGGLVFTFAGTWLLLERTALVRISFVDVSPLLLAFFGLYLVWQGATPASK